MKSGSGVQTKYNGAEAPVLNASARCGKIDLRRSRAPQKTSYLISVPHYRGLDQPPVQKVQRIARSLRLAFTI